MHACMPTRLLTGQSITPHWAIGVRSLPRAAARSGREAGVEPRTFESQVRHANHYTTQGRTTSFSIYLLVNSQANWLEIFNRTVYRYGVHDDSFALSLYIAR